MTMDKDSEMKVVLLKFKPNVWLNSRLDTVEEIVSELENRFGEIIGHNAAHREYEQMGKRHGVQNEEFNKSHLRIPVKIVERIGRGNI